VCGSGPTLTSDNLGGGTVRNDRPATARNRRSAVPEIVPQHAFHNGHHGLRRRRGHLEFSTIVASTRIPAPSPVAITRTSTAGAVDIDRNDRNRISAAAVTNRPVRLRPVTTVASAPSSCASRRWCWLRVCGAPGNAPYKRAALYRAKSSDRVWFRVSAVRQVRQLGDQRWPVLIEATRPQSGNSGWPITRLQSDTDRFGRMVGLVEDAGARNWSTIRPDA
jgi:hypothetical protein